MVMNTTSELRPRDLRQHLRPTSVTAAAGDAGFSTLAVLEREQVQRALEKTGGNQSEAARLLGIHRNALRRKLERQGLR